MSLALARLLLARPLAMAEQQVLVVPRVLQAEGQAMVQLVVLRLLLLLVVGLAVELAKALAITTPLVAMDSFSLDVVSVSQ